MLSQDWTLESPPSTLRPPPSTLDLDDRLWTIEQGPAFASHCVQSIAHLGLELLTSSLVGGSFNLGSAHGQWKLEWRAWTFNPAFCQIGPWTVHRTPWAFESGPWALGLGRWALGLLSVEAQLRYYTLKFGSSPTILL